MAHYRVTIGYIDDNAPEPGTDYGVPGNRPLVLSRPNASNTGARFDTVETLTGPQALTAILNAPVESDGRRYLRRAHITSGITLRTTGGTNIGNNALVFEDCVIDTRAAGPIYALSCFYQAGESEPATWPEFRNCNVLGGVSATLRGGWVRLLKCDMSYGVDILKPFQSMEVWASYLHDCYRPVSAHCDIIQIVVLPGSALFHYNNFVGFTSDDSPSDPNSWVSGVLQTGTISGDIGTPTESIVFRGNWVEGGRYGYRGGGGGSDNPNGYTINYLFRDNRFIRGSFQYGPVYTLTGGFDSSNVWDDDNTPVPYQGI